MSPGRRPNVLWIMFDQWRAQATGYNGDPNACTPNLDRLAAQGTNFRCALAAHPLCVPFRGALFTGQQSHVNGVTGHYSSLGADKYTIAHHLAKEGYDTALIGKWHLYEPHGPQNDWSHLVVTPPERRGGFEHWEAFESGNVMQDPWFHTADDPIPRRRPGYQADVVVDAAQQYLKTRDDDTPWFLVVSAEPPHPPYDTAPDEFRRRYRPEDIVLRPNVPLGGAVEAKAREQLAGYYAHIEASDAAIGRLLDWLDETGLAQDTIVFFFADHGDMLGSLGFYQKSMPLEESIRIPLLVRWPGRTPEGHVSDALITEVDYVSTTCALLGLDPPPELQGRDLSAAALGSSDPGPAAALLQYEEHGHEEAVRLPWRAVRTAEAMFGCTPHHEEWLFDLIEDPYETRDLTLVAGAGRALRERMRDVLTTAMAEVGDSFPLPPPFESDIPHIVPPPVPEGMVQS